MTQAEAKFAFKILTAISIFFSMLYVAAVDSFSNSEIFLYALPLAGLWYLVSILNKKAETKTEE